MIITEVLAKFTLWSLGWQSLTKETVFKLLKNERVIAVFSHTSYIDFYILTLYLLAYPRSLSTIRTLVKPQPFNYAGVLLRWMGAIPSSSISKKELDQLTG